MKKLTISFLAVIFSIGAAFSQPVSDQGVIPVGVTLNSILRLNIVSGGNIEYVVNTIGQYSGGIAPQAMYETHFTVASSVNFDVTLQADEATFIGVDDATHLISLENLGYTVATTAGAGSTLLGALTTLTAAQQNIITPSTGNAGNILQNVFSLQWELATGNVIGAQTVAVGTLLAQSIPSDRYVVNVILELSQN